MELERIDIQPTETIEGYRVRPGKPLPFGVSTVPGGLNFSVYTSAGTSCTLVLLSRSENKIIKERNQGFMLKLEKNLLRCSWSPDQKLITCGRNGMMLCWSLYYLC